MIHPVGGGDWERVNTAVLRLRRSPEELPDLIVEDIIFPDVMRPGTGYTIQAKIKNQGIGPAGGSTAELYVDDVLSGSATVPALNAGVSTIVSFTPQVNLAADCYEFKAVADSAGVTGESDEDNNETSEHYQVGNVIVVRNNNDFDDLVTEGLARTDGTTYYIEDLTITNCVGCGITIENTTSPFVIDNCAVQNCGYNSSGTAIASCSGICLKNVTNGEVIDSVIEHNTEHGISTLDYSTQVDITNCTLCDHDSGYGVEIGLVTLTGGEIPDFITVACSELYNNYYGIEAIGNDCTLKGNIVRDNSGYGIYVFGNNNELYNNTIEENDDYGIILYNSTGNEIYWNDLTNNNGGVQGSDNRATNTWNTPTSVDYCYNGGTYTNFTGNYWDDWTTPDSTGDGIVDTPYALDGGAGAEDSYPLVVPWSLCGDVDRSGDVSVNIDAMKVFRNAIYEEPVCCGWAADVDCSGDVSVNIDAMKVFRNAIYEEPLDCCKDC